MFSFNRLIRVLLILALVLLCGAASAENTLEVPASTRVIQAEAFANLKTARAVTLPEGIQEIHSRAFANSSITSINLPSSLTFIADDAFANSSLTTVIAEEGSEAYYWAVTNGYINNIDYKAVYKSAVNDAMKKHNEIVEDEMDDYTIPITYALSDITGDGICELLIRQIYAKHYIGYWIYGTDGKTSFYMGDFSCDSFGLYGYKSGVLYLDSYKGYFYLGLAEWTGDGFNNTTLFEGTFDRDGDPPTLEDLVSYYDPSRLLNPIPEFLDMNEWYESSPIEDFEIEHGVLKRYIGNGGDVVIPNNVTSIGYEAFYGCTSLTNVTIPNSVTSIGNGAFEDCTNLTNVTIPNSVTSIGRGAFHFCTHLNNITIPKGITSIDDYVFSGCYSLANVAIPNSVTSIGENAFHDCCSLMNVTIPNSVTSIDYGAFSGCDGLKNVTIPDSVTSIGYYAFEECVSLTDVTIPNSITSIMDYTFLYCESLKSVTIPNSVTSIGDRAFDGCSSLTSVTIPNSVTSINDTAFEDCDKLKTINVEKGSYAETWAKNKGYNVNYDADTQDEMSVPERLFLGVGQEFIPTIVFKDNATHGYTLSSSDNSVVSIKGNKLVGKKQGSANITVISGNNEASFTVYVCLKLTSSMQSMSIYDVDNLVCQITLFDHAVTLSNDSSWMSSDPNVVSVDQNGRIAAWKQGSAVITYTCNLNESSNEADNKTIMTSRTINVTGNTSKTIKEMFHDELRSLDIKDNPLKKSAIIYKIMYDSLVEADGGECKEDFARDVLEYLSNAPEKYRDIFVYSFFEYSIYAEKGQSNIRYNYSEHKIYIMQFAGTPYIPGIATFFHECGHAVDHLCAEKQDMTLSDVDEVRLKEVVRKDTLEFLSKVMLSYFAEKNVIFDSREISQILNAIMDYRNSGTQYHVSDNVFEINQPVGIDKDYVDDYLNFVEYACRYLLEYWRKPDVDSEPYPYSIYQHNNSMLMDMVSGTTNNAIYAGVGHTDKYYWYDDKGKWTNYQQREAWAEFFSSMIMQLEENVTANQTDCKETCKYMDDVTAIVIRDYFVSKVRNA